MVTIGQKVKIRLDLEKHQVYGIRTCLDSHLPWKGKTITVRHISTDQTQFDIEESSDCLAFSEEMTIKPTLALW